MILQAEAERKKRANILESEGDMQSQINLAEAKKMAQVLRAEGKAEATIKKATASAEALKNINVSLAQTNGLQAANFVMGERFIEAYKKVGQEKNTVIMSGNVIDANANVSESFSVLDRIIQAKNKDKDA